MKGRWGFFLCATIRCPEGEKPLETMTAYWCHQPQSTTMTENDCYDVLTDYHFGIWTHCEYTHTHKPCKRRQISVCSVVMYPADVTLSTIVIWPSNLIYIWPSSTFPASLTFHIFPLCRCVLPATLCPFSRGWSDCKNAHDLCCCCSRGKTITCSMRKNIMVFLSCCASQQLHYCGKLSHTRVLWDDSVCIWL